MKVIAYIETGFSEKFGIPRQSGLVQNLKGRIIFVPEYRVPEAVKGLEEYSHIWILWDFSQAHRDKWSPTVRPPRLGGNKRMGVFATRSPFRPNPIGLSCVKLERIVQEPGIGTIIEVSGVDMVSGTPVYDIKPYLSYCDSHAEAVCGFADEVKKHELMVEFSGGLQGMLSESQREALIGILSQDPRTAYVDDEKRVWGITYEGLNVKFVVAGNVLRIIEIS